MTYLTCLEFLQKSSMSRHPVLTALGLRPGKPGLYLEMISKVREEALDRKIVTIEFVIELQDLVQVHNARQPKIPLEPDKITVRQYCHILAFLGDQKNYPEERLLSEKMVNVFWKTRDQKTLRERLAQGKVCLQDAWSPLAKYIPIPSSPIPSENGGGLVLYIYSYFYSCSYLLLQVGTLLHRILDTARSSSHLSSSLP